MRNITSQAYEHTFAKDHAASTGNDVHVLPEWQLNDHDSKTCNCFCCPFIELQPNGSALVIHNPVTEC